MRPLSLGRVLLLSGSLLVVLVAVSVTSLAFGAVPLPPRELLACLAAAVHPASGALSTDCRIIVLELRLPRVLLGALVGAALSVAGAGFQALLRNPLADPYVLGVSSGAALGAILSLLVGPPTTLLTGGAAFLGALLTVACVYLLGQRHGQLDTYTLLLAGVITASFLSAMIMFLMTSLPGRDLRGIAFWLMGDLSSPLPLSLRWLVVAVLLTMGALYTTAADLNLLVAGEQEALHLGVNVRRVKVVVYLTASLLTALAVSVSGAIGYVGLLVPHGMRLLLGSDYRMLLPASALGGAAVVVLADTLARTVVAPTELPVGAMTAIVGAPAFIYLLRRRLG